MKVQLQVPVLDGDQSADRAIRFRVGIDIGDAIADGTDLHGDAVNVVARLQAEYPPGGVCVSRSVRDHVHGRLDLAFEALGPLHLKNIARPVEAFVVRLDPSKMPRGVGGAALGWSLRKDGDPALGVNLVSHTDWLWRELALLQEQQRQFELALAFVDRSEIAR